MPDCGVYKGGIILSSESRQARRVGMETNRITRRLAAILAADVVGYTRLVERDTAGTVAAWQSARDELIRPVVADRKGRIVKFTGDGFLAEFQSVEDAVRAAIQCQRSLTGNSLRFRMGIHLGDVMDDGQDIHGEGVNIAARLESLSESGGITVSGMVYEAIRNRVDASFEDLGDHVVKNVSAPVRVFRVASGSEPQGGHWEPVPLPLPGRPSVAVLPFDNLSEDEEQEFFADGMTDDLITGLSRFRSLFIIARNSTFTFKGRAIDVRDVARQLGVRYVLQGSVRRGGDRIRVTAQLIEADSGNHVWAERYDHDLKDLFAIQDCVTEAIIAAIAPEIDEMERKRAKRRALDSLDAWGIYQRGLAAYHSATRESVEEAIALFDSVNGLDPSFAPAFAMAAEGRCRLVVLFEPADRGEFLKQADRKARTATTLDARDSICLRSESHVLGLLGRHDIAIEKAEQAVALNPNDAPAWYRLGYTLGSAGRPEDALPHLDNAIRLSPRDSGLAGHLTYRAFLLFDLERYEEAYAGSLRASRSPNPRNVAFETVVASLIRLGRQQEAEQALNDYLAHKPDASLDFVRRRQWIARSEAKERYVAALREAGLPERAL